MNKEQFQGQWNQLKGLIKEQWGKLTDDDIAKIEGKRDQLLGQIQKKYGYTKEKAEQELKNFEKKHSTTGASSEDLDLDDQEEATLGSNKRNNKPKI